MSDDLTKRIASLPPGAVKWRTSWPPPSLTPAIVYRDRILGRCEVADVLSFNRHGLVRAQPNAVSLPPPRVWAPLTEVMGPLEAAAENKGYVRGFREGVASERDPETVEAHDLIRRAANRIRKERAAAEPSAVSAPSAPDTSEQDSEGRPNG